MSKKLTIRSFRQYRDLYIRGNSLVRTSTGSSSLITTCPTSMELLMHLKALNMMHMGSFKFQTVFITNDEAPRFETNEGIYNNLNELNAYGPPLSLEPRVTDMDRTTLEQMETRKHAMMDSLTNVRSAFMFGYRLFCHPDTNWMTTELNNIRARAGPGMDDAMIEHSLVQQMEVACQYLSNELGNDINFSAALCLTSETGTKALYSLSTVDIHLAASGSLIRRCFEIENVSPYATKIGAILYKYISLWAHNDIIYSWFIKTPTVAREYTTTVGDNPELLATIVREASVHASGSQGDVYKVSLTEDNITWRLEKNDYAFKVSKGDSIKYSVAMSVMNEAIVLMVLPYENITKVLGHGTGRLDNREVYFFVMEWIPGGSLYDRMEDLDLSRIKKVLIGVAYVLHLVYTGTRSCIIDIKPKNILLDENDDPVLCDFGSYAHEKDAVAGNFGGTPIYHDNSIEATHGRDIFGYGILIFQLLTDDVDEMSSGQTFADEILKYVDEGMDLGTLIKPRLQQEAHVVKKLLDIGVKCISEANHRPSALDILKKFQEIW